MEIGIGLPNTLSCLEGSTLIGWARLAELHGFTSLSTIGRVAWPSYDEFVALAAAAAVTERIRVMTNVALMPTWDAARFAKATASLDQISGGRPDDFEAIGRDMSSRGRDLDHGLEVMHATWRGEATPWFDTPFGPDAVKGRIPILFGGDPTKAGPRAARWDGGYTIGGAPFEMAAAAVNAVKDAYRKEGGAGDPRICALNYFSLGDEHTHRLVENLRAYYGFTGEYAEMIAQGAARSADEIRRRVDGFAGAGVDELVWTPSVGDLDQVERLAVAVMP